MKTIIATLAAVVALSALAPAANARPHGHCHWWHHHMVCHHHH
jgi:Spy/CpxP family protein refolding chaperone